jgi:hypothetical protein
MAALHVKHPSQIVLRPSIARLQPGSILVTARSVLQIVQLDKYVTKTIPGWTTVGVESKTFPVALNGGERFSFARIRIPYFGVDIGIGGSQRKKLPTIINGHHGVSHICDKDSTVHDLFLAIFAYPPKKAEEFLDM